MFSTVSGLSDTDSTTHSKGKIEFDCYVCFSWFEVGYLLECESDLTFDATLRIRTISV